MSIAEVQARMAAITAQFVTPLSGVRPLTPSSAPSSSGSTFATELAKAAAVQSAVPTTGTPVAGTAAAVLTEAKSYLGVPYVWGGTNPRTGLDCSGLTQLVYGHAGVDLPRVSWQQARAGTAVASLAAARPGDLLAFNSPVDHVAIYLGDNQMIHAPKPGRSVEISDVYETPSAIRRVLPDPPVATAGLSTVPSTFPLLGGLPA